MSALSIYLKFLACLAVGLAGIVLFLKAVIDQFFTDKGLSDYRIGGRITLPTWGYHTYYGPQESSLLALLTRRIARVPPLRRAAELEVRLDAD